MEANNTHHVSNSTGFVVCPSYTAEKRLAKLIAFGILFLGSLIGNGLACLVVYKNRSMRTTINYLLINMAVSDLTVPLLVATRKIVELSTDSLEWRVGGIAGDLLCKLVYFVSDLSPMVSISSLVMISFDRFKAIVVPFKSAKYHDKFRMYFIGFTWVFAMLFCSPYFYFMELKEHPDKKEYYCIMAWDTETRRAYTVPLTVIFIIIPFALLTIMYSCILYKMKTRPNNLSQTDKGKQRRQASKRNITILSFTVVFMFALCWGPYFALVMLSSFKWNWKYDSCSYQNFIFIVQFLAYSNAAINPLLYFLLLKNFRAGLEHCCSVTQSWKETRRRRSSTNQLTKDARADKICNTYV